MAKLYNDMNVARSGPQQQLELLVLQRHAQHYTCFRGLWNCLGFIDFHPKWIRIWLIKYIFTVVTGRVAISLLLITNMSFLSPKLLFSKQFLNPEIPGFGRQQSRDLELRKAAGLPDCNPKWCFTDFRSQYWPFGLRDVISHVTIGLVVNFNQPYITQGFWDTKFQRYRIMTLPFRNYVALFVT